MRDSIEALYEMDYAAPKVVAEAVPGGSEGADPALDWEPKRLRGEIKKLEDEMRVAAGELRFEEAAKLRDRLRELEALELAR